MLLTTIDQIRNGRKTEKNLKFKNFIRKKMIEKQIKISEKPGIPENLQLYINGKIVNITKKQPEIISENKNQEIDYSELDLDSEVIGVPTKVGYLWGDNLGLLGLIQKSI
jgi:hypothetical protein